MDSDQPIGDALNQPNPSVGLGPAASIPVSPEPLFSRSINDAVNTTPSLLTQSPVVTSQPQIHESVEKIKLLRFNKSAAIATIITLALISLVGVGSILLASNSKSKTNAVNNSSIEQQYKTQNLNTSNVSGYNQLLTGKTQNLTVNGQLSVSSSLILSPSTAPSHPILGQLYYNGASNSPYFYNGQNFVSLVPPSGGTIAGGSPNLSLGNGLSLQGNSLVNSGVLSINGTPNQILVSAKSGNLQVSLPSNVNTSTIDTNSATSNTFNALGQYEVNGTPLSSANLSDGANIAKLSNIGSQIFTGNNEFTGSLIDQNAVNSTNAFSIQNASGANIFTTNTANNSIDIGQGTTLISSITTSISPNSVTVSGNYAYVVDGNYDLPGYLQIFNISVPSSPVLIGTTFTGIDPSSITVSGNYAYVVNNYDYSLQIFNISNPSSPILVSTTSTGNNPNSVTVSGNYAYVVDGYYNPTDSLQIFNISNPSSPILVSTTSTGIYPEFVAVSGNYAYVVNSDSDSLQIFNISNPSSPILVSTTPTGVSPNSVTVSGNYAYVVNLSSSTMQIFNISNPSSPILVSTTSTGNRPNSVALTNDYAYVVTESNTLEIFNISNPYNPNLLDTATTGNCPSAVVAINTTAYVTNSCSNSLQIFSYALSNNINVNVEGSLSVSQIISTNTLTLQGTNTNTSASESANLITNTNFSDASAWFATSNSYPYFMAVSGNYAYIVNSGSDTLQIFNISTQSNTSLVSTMPTGADPASVAVSGNYAYVVNALSNNLQIFNVSNPSSPSLIGTASTSYTPFSVAVYGNYAYIVNGDSNNLQIFNVSNPSSPSLIGTASTGSYPISVAVYGNYA